MCVCMYSFLYLFEDGNMTLYTSKYGQRKALRVGKSFISLGIFPSESWKSHAFPPPPVLTSFLAPPLFFFFSFPSTSASFCTNTSPGLFSNPKWLGNSMTKRTPFVDDLQVEMSLFGPVLSWRVSDQTLAEHELENKANALCCREECIYLCLMRGPLECCYNISLEITCL